MAYKGYRASFTLLRCGETSQNKRICLTELSKSVPVSSYFQYEFITREAKGTAGTAALSKVIKQSWPLLFCRDIPTDFFA